jgi:hypothetical protein
MKLNMDFMLGSGTILIWVGATLGLISIILFIASGGYVDSSTFNITVSEDGSRGGTITSGSMCLGLLPRLVCILPFFAGLMLAFSGWYIRDSIREMKVTLREIGANTDE